MIKIVSELSVVLPCSQEKIKPSPAKDRIRIIYDSLFITFKKKLLYLDAIFFFN